MTFHEEMDRFFKSFTAEDRKRVEQNQAYMAAEAQEDAVKATEIASALIVGEVQERPKAPRMPSEPIKDVKVCPICGKYCDAKSGFPCLYDFPGHRLRYHAHQECARKHGLFGHLPFAPKIEDIAR